MGFPGTLRHGISTTNATSGVKSISALICFQTTQASAITLTGMVVARSCIDRPASTYSPSIARLPALCATISAIGTFVLWFHVLDYWLAMGQRGYLEQSIGGPTAAISH